MIRRAIQINGASLSALKKKVGLYVEKRRNARVSVSVSVSCASVDALDRLLDRNKGIIKNVSQAGLKLEAENRPCSERLKLAFVDLNKGVVAIFGQVVSSQNTPTGSCKIGVKLEGSETEIVHFISKLVKLFHYTKNMR
jgi:hypothetical protein